MKNKLKLSFLMLATLSLLSQNTISSAKPITYKLSENKQNPKIVSLLKTARKQVEKGKNQDAINTYWKILDLDAGEPYAYLELGELYKNLHIYNRSIEMLSTGLDIAYKELDNNEICRYYCLLTEIYVIEGQQGLANKSLLKAAEISPKNPLPRKVLGDIYLKNNRIANAAKAYRKAIELDNDYQPAIDALNDLKKEYGDKLPKEQKNKEYISKTAVNLGNSSNTEKTENITLSKNPEKQENNNYSKLNRINQIPLPEKNATIKQSIKIVELTEDPIKKDDSKILPIATKSDNENEENEYYLDVFLAGDAEQKEEALNYFINKGKKGLREIEELIYNPDPDIRILAIRALPLFDEFKEEVITILQDAADDENQEVSEEIDKALSLLK